MPVCPVDEQFMHEEEEWKGVYKYDAINISRTDGFYLIPYYRMPLDVRREDKP